MNSFEILKREIAECRIRAKSNETIQVLSHLQEFAENNLNNGWISIDDDLPKVKGRYLCYYPKSGKQTVEPFMLEHTLNDKDYM